MFNILNFRIQGKIKKLVYQKSQYLHATLSKEIKKGGI